MMPLIKYQLFQNFQVIILEKVYLMPLLVKYNLQDFPLFRYLLTSEKQGLGGKDFSTFSPILDIYLNMGTPKRISNISFYILAIPQ